MDKRKLIGILLYSVLSLSFYPLASSGYDIEDAQNASTLINNGNLAGFIHHYGHTGILINPYPDAPPSGENRIIESRGDGPDWANYNTFMGGAPEYLGHYRTNHSCSKYSKYRLNVVKFAKQGLGDPDYCWLDLYLYEWSLKDDNKPYDGVVPDQFRCDGLAEWCNEQATGNYYTCISTSLKLICKQGADGPRNYLLT